LPREKEFTLTAFGFPEPEGGAARSHWLMWVLDFGIACIAVSLVLRHLLRKRVAARG